MNPNGLASHPQIRAWSERVEMQGGFEPMKKG